MIVNQNSWSLGPLLKSEQPCPNKSLALCGSLIPTHPSDPLATGNTPASSPPGFWADAAPQLDSHKPRRPMLRSSASARLPNRHLTSPNPHNSEIFGLIRVSRFNPRAGSPPPERRTNQNISSQYENTRAKPRNADLLAGVYSLPPPST